MISCRSAVTAWLGGIVRTEKNPGECPVSRLIATMRIQRSVLSGARSRNRRRNPSIRASVRGW